MISTVFYWMLNMSIAGSLIGCVVLLLRRINLPRRYLCLLWFLPLIRLMIPFGLPSKYSLLTLIAPFTTKSVPVEAVPEFLPQLSYTNFIMAVDRYNAQAINPLTDTMMTFKTEALEKVFSIGGTVWAIIFVAALLTMAVLYIMNKSALRDAVHQRDNIYVSDRVIAPALYGVLKPKIIIPPYVSEENLSFVEVHESAHRKRGDNLFRLIGMVAACMYWFNPLAWIMLKQYLEDVELACDETVLQELGPEKKKAYAQALIDCAAGKTLFVPAFSAVFGGAKLRMRIENILSYKRLTLASTVVFLIFMVFLAAVLLTNASL